jgi:hypothetical protein
MTKRKHLTLGFIAAGLCLGLAASAQADEPKLPAANKSCPMKTLATIEVRGTQHGRFLVPVSIAGHDVWMGLDLKGGILVLYGAAIADWHLQTIPMENGARSITVNGKAIHEMARVDFTLGSHGFRQWPMVVVPASDFDTLNTYEGKPVVGQLSSIFLMAVDAELNLAQNKITLFEQVKCGSDAAYWGGPVTGIHFEVDPTGLLHFPMLLDDQEIQTSLDTYQPSSRISSEATKKFFGFDEQSPEVQSDLLADGTRSQSYRAMALTAQGLQIKNSKIELLPMKDCHPDRLLSRLNGIGCEDVYGMTPFTIGTDLLKRLRIYIASKEHMIYFTRVDSPAPPTGTDASTPPQ